MRRRNRIDDAIEEGRIELTPLIDVVFVVLIMFILIAPMLEVDNVKLARAGHREQVEATNMSSLTIHVHENNTIWINKKQVTPENLFPVLKALKTKNSKLTPQLFQDRKAHFGTYQMVKNALEEAGYDELDVVLEPSQ
ncbi:MAG: biopolymer transporter ExbD [Verrucomicrobia bacterium]|nr:biopolymer transporter ExbD [Verrucomicrobiota bacterium]